MTVSTVERHSKAFIPVAEAFCVPDKKYGNRIAVSSFAEAYVIRLYLDRNMDNSHDWFVLVLGEERDDYDDIILGEGPELGALISDDYFAFFGIANPEWYWFNNGIIGDAFKSFIGYEDAD